MPVASPRSDAAGAGFRRAQVAWRTLPMLHERTFKGTLRWVKEVEEWLGDAVDRFIELATVLNNVLDGKINSTGTVTLSVSSTSTTLSDRRIGPESVILFMPTTANARSEGTPWVSARATTKGQCTLNHTSNSASDLNFTYVILG
jgi:hypothetical protein